MKTYTYGKTPNEVIRQSLPHKYPMELNKSDMQVLLQVLLRESNSPRYTKTSRWARDIRSSILETIGIEEV